MGPSFRADTEIQRELAETPAVLHEQRGAVGLEVLGAILRLRDAVVVQLVVWIRRSARIPQGRSQFGVRDRAVAVAVERRVELVPVREPVHGGDEPVEVTRVERVEPQALRERAGRDLARRHARQAGRDRRVDGAADGRRVQEAAVALEFETALEGVVLPHPLHQSADALGAANVLGVGPEPAALFVGERGTRPGPVLDRVRRVPNHGQIGQLAVVLRVGRVDEQRADQPLVVEPPAIATLHARPVLRVGDVPLDASAEVTGIVEEGQRHGVVRRRPPGALHVALVLLVVHRAEELLRVERRDVVVARQTPVAGEEPGAIGQDRPAEGERRVERREHVRLRILVGGRKVVVLEEVVGRSAVAVRPRLGDDVGEQPRCARVLGRDGAREHLLLLDDFRVQVRAERPRLAVGHIDAVEVVEVVARHADVAADVAVVETGLGRRVAGLLRIVRHHARHQLQVALVATASRQRLGQPQRDVLSARGRRRIDDRRRRRDAHFLGDPAHRQRDAEHRGLAGAHEDVLEAARLEAGQGRRDDIGRRRFERDEDGLAGRVGHDGALGSGVGCRRGHGHARHGAAALIKDDHFNRAGTDHLPVRGAHAKTKREQHCPRETTTETHTDLLENGERHRTHNARPQNRPPGDAVQQRRRLG